MKAILERKELQDREKVTLYNQVLYQYDDMDDKRLQLPLRVAVLSDDKAPARVEGEAVGPTAEATVV